MGLRVSKSSERPQGPTDQAPGADAGRSLPRIEGSIDEPSPVHGAVPGQVLVRGWVAHRRRDVLGVVVMVDGAVVGGCEVSGERPDVAAAHPALRRAGSSGWSTVVDLSGVKGPDLRIDVFAILAPRSDTPSEADADRSFGQPVHFSSVTVGVRRAGDAVVRGGCFVVRDDLTSGLHKIYGLAEAPGGVSRVEVFCEGVSAGLARTALPGRFEGAQQGPDSAVALFERVVDVPGGRDRVSMTAVVTPCEGEPFEIRPWTARVEEDLVDAWSPERLEVVRRRTDETIRMISQRAPREDRSNAAPRVLVVTHDLGLGGGQLYLQELLKRLSRRGVECFVASPRGGRLVAELEEHGIPVLVTGTFDPHDAESYEAQVRQIALWAAEQGCDVALANTMSAFPGVDAAHRLGLEVVWAIHESFPVPQFLSEAFPPPRPTYIEERSTDALRRTRRAVFEAAATLDLYAPWLAPDAGEVVPYGVDFSEIDDYRARVDRSRLRAELGFSEETLVLLVLGTIEPRKAQVNITQAFAGSAALAGRDVSLVLVGAKEGSPYVEAIEDYLKASGESRVRVEPVQPDTYKWYHAADVLLSGSDVESLPRSMLEAMAFDRPIASTSVFGIPELVSDGVDGFLCESRDLLSLRAMLERVASTPREQLASMGARARAKVLERHDPEIYTAHYDALLTAMASGSAARR